MGDKAGDFHWKLRLREATFFSYLSPFQTSILEMDVGAVVSGFHLSTGITVRIGTSTNTRVITCTTAVTGLSCEKV